MQEKLQQMLLNYIIITRLHLSLGYKTPKSVFLSMGLFEMDGGCSVNPYYDLGSPLFDKIVIHLDPKYYPGGTFTIKAINNSKENIYVQSATWNGKPFNSLKLPHSEVVKGGVLELKMGDQPNVNFGIQN